MYYYLLSPDKLYFIPHVIRRGKIVKKEEPLLKESLIEKINSLEISNIMDSSVKTKFWDNASQSLKKACLISYYLSKQKNPRILVNVETDNWEKLNFYNKFWEENRIFSGLKGVVKPVRWSRSKIMITGNHKKSIRFENIHMTQDLICNTLRYAVHWDVYFPGLSPLSWVKHNLTDVIRVFG